MLYYIVIVYYLQVFCIYYRWMWGVGVYSDTGGGAELLRIVVEVSTKAFMFGEGFYYGS